VGGTSKSAYRRAITECQGWYGFAMDFDTAANAITGLQAAASRYQRPGNLPELEISITPRGRTTKADEERWAEMGVSRLILLQPGQDQSALLDYVSQIGEQLINKD